MEKSARMNCLFVESQGSTLQSHAMFQDNPLNQRIRRTSYTQDASKSRQSYPPKSIPVLIRPIPIRLQPRSLPNNETYPSEILDTYYKPKWKLPPISMIICENAHRPALPLAKYLG